MMNYKDKLEAERLATIIGETVMSGHARTGLVEFKQGWHRVTADKLGDETVIVRISRIKK